MAESSECDVRLGVIALRQKLITRDQLLAALTHWADQPGTSLADHLVAQGAISRADRSALERAAAGPVFPETIELSDQPVVAPLNAATESPPSGPSRYRVIRPHAKGGLGEVFLAHDDELNREVALKELQVGKDRGDSRPRFVFEAEVTGRLEHPGIIPIYGLGRHADGRPYYAMRFIKGDHLGEAVRAFHEAGPPDYHSTRFRRLLQQFIVVCQAVAYAHSRGVLHRDLKPGNILLGPFGETLVVDWGLAKTSGSVDPRPALDGDSLRPASSDALTPTQHGAMLGTPAYMSPEQIAGRLDEVGPTSDVFSLGATLFHIVVGQSPHAGSDLVEVMDRTQAGWIPSPRSQRADVPKGLDAICRTAMAHRPSDRYPTALALASDIERWLADEPVSVLAEPLPARARRWMRKHPGAVTGLAAALIVGILGLGGGLYFVNAERARTELARQDEQTQRTLAQAHLAFAKKGNELLGSVFAGLDPKVIAETGLPLQDVLRENLAQAVRELDSAVIDDPIAVAGMQNTLGLSLTGLGDYDRATTLFEKALAARAVHLPESDPDRQESLSNLGMSYLEAGRPREALPRLEESLRLRRTHRGASHSSTLTSMSNVAGAYDALGRQADALALYEQVLRVARTALPAEHPITIRGMNNVAACYESLGRIAEGMPLYEESLRLTQRLRGQDHPETLVIMNNLADAYEGLGRHADAIALHESTIRLARQRLGPDHPNTLRTMVNLAGCYDSANRLADAISLYEDVLRRMKNRLGTDHLDTLSTMNNLASAYQNAGRLADAIALFEQTLAMRRTQLGEDHPKTLMSCNNLAHAYEAAGRRADAMPLTEAVFAGLERSRFQHELAESLVHNVCRSLEDAGQLARSVEFRRKWLAVVREQSGPRSSDVARELAYLGECLIAQKKHAEARDCLTECLAIRTQVAPNTWTTFNTMSMLGEALSELNDDARAEALLRDGQAGLKKHHAEIPESSRARRLRRSIERLVRHHESRSQADAAEAWRKELRGLPQPLPAKPTAP